MSVPMKLDILSPERRLVEGLEVDSVLVVGAEGQIEILPGHAPFVSTLETGVFKYRTPQGQSQSGVISSGFVQVHDDHVRVLAETLELKGEIDVGRARRAQEKAEAALKAADLTESKFRKYQLKLERALIRQQFAGKE